MAVGDFNRERAVDHLVHSVGNRVRPSTLHCINVTVHGIGPVNRELDPDEDLTWLRTGQFEHLLDAVAPREDIRLTFDDGNASDVQVALPRLLERGLTAQFFVLAGMVGEPGRLNADDVRELAAAGMSVGSHGWAHRDWRRLDADQASEEIGTASSVLRELTGQPVDRVAIPFGSYDRHVLRLLREANVARVYTSDGGPARRDAWLQPRITARHDLDRTWLERTLDGGGPMWLQARRFAARRVKCVRGRP